MDSAAAQEFERVEKSASTSSATTVPMPSLSPSQYLQEMRLQLAKDLLLNGKFLTVKETATAVGFRDVPYFSKLFQARFGSLPSAYLR